MFTSTLLTFAIAALSAPSVLATIFVTAPVATTTCTGGQTCTVSWQDDGVAPLLAAIGLCKVGLYVGGAQSQTWLQDIAPAPVDVSTTGSIVFTVDPSVGESSTAYFVRFESVALKDTTPYANAYLQFSAKFLLTGMTGTFSATIQEQIAGQTPVVAASPAAAAGAVTTTAATSVPASSSGLVKTSASTKPTSSTTASAASSSGTSNSAITASASNFGLAGLAGVVVAAIACAL